MLLPIFALAAAALASPLPFAVAPERARGLGGLPLVPSPPPPLERGLSSPLVPSPPPRLERDLSLEDLSRDLEARDALTGVTLLRAARPPGTGFCLDEDAGRAQLWQCHGGANQQWRLERVRLDADQFKAKPVTRFRVRRVDTDMCLHFVAPGESPLPPCASFPLPPLPAFSERGR